jgi:MATE family multidrug resistance protein
MDGFAYAAEALTGRFMGEQSKAKFSRTVKLLFRWGVGFAALFSLTYVVLGDQILLLLTDNKDVLRHSDHFIYWVWAIPLITFSAFLWDGIFIGATASRSMRNAMLISTLVFFIPMYFMFIGPLGNHGLWLAFLLFQLSRGIIQTIQSSCSIFKKFN